VVDGEASIKKLPLSNKKQYAADAKRVKGRELHEDKYAQRELTFAKGVLVLWLI